MTSPAEIADAFDRIDEENRRWIEGGLKSWVIDTATEHRVDDWRTTGVAVGAGLADALYSFLAMSGRGLVDVLRLGETIRRPSVGAVFRDGLRILTVLPLGRILKTGLVNLGARAASGGPMSCVVTGNTVALRMSGTRLGITLDELWQEANAAGRNPVAPWNAPARPLLSPAHDAFKGVPSLRALVPTLEALGATVENPALHSIDDVAQLARQGQGPVPFGVTWWRTAHGMMAPAGRHMMVAYRSMSGEIMIADQGGVQSLGQLMFNLRAAGTGLSVEGGYLVRHARWIGDAAALQRGVLLGRGVPDLFAGPPPMAEMVTSPRLSAEVQQNWLGRGLEVPLYHLPGPIAVRADRELRRSLGRPPRPPLKRRPSQTPKRTMPPLWDDPNLEGAEPAVRRAWAALLGQGMAHGTDVSLAAAAASSGLSALEFDYAMLQLDLIYQRVDLIWFQHPEAGGPKVRWTYR